MTPLHLFPTAGFDRSTTTPVLLGVLISWFFAETFGWVFAGLVVPGYLAAVFAIDPRAGMVDVAEAIFTYGLARMIGEHLPRTGVTSRVFGRERFLLIVLCSIVVRLAVEGAILPRFAPHAAGSFFSIGLVVVPLAANACWKTGLGKGLVQNGVPTLIVFLLLKFVLLPYTNLSLAGFELATEDVAASFLSSPKAYILLITGAILAASANVLDGWDFNGILIPALLALVVLEPVKFAATFAEALVIVAIATVILKTTRLGRANVEGPRKLVLFFSIDYAMRFAFAGVLGKSLPGADVVGLMGFGYLLPTLLAVKIAQRQSAPLVLLPTAQVSVGAFALGTLIGFSAAMVDTAPSAARGSISRPMPPSPSDPEAAGLWVSGLARNTPHDGKGTSPLAAAELVAIVDRAVAEADPSKAKTGPLHAQRLDKDVVLLRERFETLEERWGDPVILATASGRAAGRRVIALVATPVTSPELGALAGRMVAEGKADGAVIAGLELANGTSPFATAATVDARALAKRDDDPGVVVALRRTNDTTGRVVFGPAGGSAARVDALLLALESKVGALPRKTGDPGASIDVLIELPGAAVASLFALEAKETSIASPAAMASLFDAVKATSTPTSPEDLLVLRRLLLDPLLSPNGARDLPSLRVAASKLGYSIVGPSPVGGAGEAIALLPNAPRPIAVLVRASGVKSTIVEVPHGFRDGLRDVALRLSTGLSADAVILGLEHGGAARGGPAMRLAHAIAVAPEGRTPRVVLVRDGTTSVAGRVALGTWGGAAKADLAAQTKKAFESMGLETMDQPLDLAVREMSGRSIFGDVPLVAATVDAAAVRTASLDDARGTARILSSSGLTTLEGTVPDAALKLAGGIPDGTPLPTSDIVDLARRATFEHSVVARRGLASAVASSAARAALVRAKNGDFLVVVAREKQGFIASATPTDPHVGGKDPKPIVNVKSLRDCAAALETGAACRAEVP